MLDVNYISKLSTKKYSHPGQALEILSCGLDIWIFKCSPGDSTEHEKLGTTALGDKARNDLLHEVPQSSLIIRQVCRTSDDHLE